MHTYANSVFLNKAGMDGSVNSLKTPSLQGWMRLYNLTFLVGIAISFTVLIIVCFFFPPPGLGIDAPFVAADGDGMPVDSSIVVEGLEYDHQKAGDGGAFTSAREDFVDGGMEKDLKGFVE